MIVVDGGGQEIALGGELFARGALSRRLGGIVVDGGYRDIGYVEQCDLPVYTRYITPMAGTTSSLGELQTSVSCGGVTVNPGDLVLADHEGLIVVEPARVRDLFDAATAIKQAEQTVIDRLDNGQTLSDGLSLTEHVSALEKGEPSALRFLE